METNSINNQLIKLLKRAETNENETIIETFVDVGPISDILSNKNSQIIYGRRGTGKTHALIYLTSLIKKRGDVSVYVDMRNIGSNNSMYSSGETPAVRATIMLRDVFSKIHAELLGVFVKYAEELDLSKTTLIMDRFADAIIEVRVEGPVQLENSTEGTVNNKEGGKFVVDFLKPSANLEFSSETGSSEKNNTKTAYSGPVRHRVSFGKLGKVFHDISTALQEKTVWILFDEWSSVLHDLQPYLADIIKRTILPVKGFVVKIASIEQRSSFRIDGPRDYIGFELGADIAADFALDDFMVYERGNERAKDFFKKLLYKHLASTKEVSIIDENDFVNKAFTQSSVFEELVRASEEVPRDAMSIVSLAAQRAFDQKISMSHIRNAARDWYLRDKDADLKEQPDVYTLLHWIIDKVIGSRKAKAFLLQNDAEHQLIDILFDARVLHILKKNISTHDKPGTRYNSYKLDYSCYVDLIATKRAPQVIMPLFYQDENFQNIDETTDVPTDDYRAIRRAILNLNDFFKQRKSVLAKNS